MAKLTGIYAGPTYAMGDVAGAESKKAEAKLRAMRRSLRRWIKFRRMNDEVALGQREARKLPQKVAQRLLDEQRDYALEQKMANELYALLSETVGPEGLPSPDVSKDPDAAVRLAQIALGNTLSESAAPQAQGILPLLIVAGGVVLIASTAISSMADLAAEKERIKCIQSGACTDYGFWLKVGAIGFVGWFAWEKMGLKKKFA